MTAATHAPSVVSALTVADLGVADLADLGFVAVNAFGVYRDQTGLALVICDDGGVTLGTALTRAWSVTLGPRVPASVLVGALVGARS